MRNYINTFQDELETELNTWWWTNQEVNNVLEEKNTFLFKWEKFLITYNNWEVLIHKNKIENKTEINFSARLSYSLYKNNIWKVFVNNFEAEFHKLYKIISLESHFSWLWSILLDFIKENLLENNDIIFLLNTAYTEQWEYINFYQNNEFRNLYLDDKESTIFSFYSNKMDFNRISDSDFNDIVKKTEYF